MSSTVRRMLKEIKYIPILIGVVLLASVAHYLLTGRICVPTKTMGSCYSGAGSTYSALGNLMLSFSLFIYAAIDIDPCDFRKRTKKATGIFLTGNIGVILSFLGLCIALLN